MDLGTISDSRRSPSSDEIAAGLYPKQTAAPSGSFARALSTGLADEASGGAMVVLQVAKGRPNTEILARSIGGAGIWLAVVTSFGAAPPAEPWQAFATDLNVLPLVRTASGARAQAVLKRRQAHQRTLTASIGAQAREALAALAISKSQMAAILGIERPHLYAWLADKVGRPTKGDRLRALLGVLAGAGVSSASPLREHLVTQPLELGAKPLFELLKGKDLDSPEVAAALASAVRLSRAIDSAAAQRIASMRATGHKAASEEETQATLDATLDAMEWDAG